MINLIIKGNMFDAFNAAHERGIALVSAAQQFRENVPAEVVASTNADLSGVISWFTETPELVMGFGYPAGTLLFYNFADTCGFNDEREPRRATVNTLATGNRAERRAQSSITRDIRRQNGLDD